MTKLGLAEQQDQLQQAEVGINHLLNDDLPAAQRVLEAQKDSPYALAGLGICAFLTAAIGLEDDRLSHSMETLGAAERAAKKHKATAAQEPGQWWTQTGLEYEIILGDVTAAESLIHILGESYAEYLKALWKLNNAWKYFAGVYKAVFPHDISPESTVASLTADLNERYQAANLSSSLSKASLAPHAHALRSGLSLTKLVGFGSRSASTSVSDVTKTTKSRSSSIAPSIPVSSKTSATSSPPNTVTHDVNGHTMPEALWTRSPITSFIISGGAFGHAIFELVFALMPPKGRKVFSWLGYGVGDRKKALKLLELVATTGVDLHASFASLALVIYDVGILMGSGWQADRTKLVTACTNVNNRSLEKHDSGTLWLVNRAKLARLDGDVVGAVRQLRAALTKPHVYRQAKSTLQFELCWVLMSQLAYEEASESFAQMVELNSWSHPTYYALAASCLSELPSRTEKQEKRMQELYEKVPASFLRKRFMGAAPSSEIYLEKRMKFYTAKSARWASEGRLKKDAQWFESTRISIALELSLYWNQYAHYPKDSLNALTRKLEGYLSVEGKKDLDTPEETALCHCILGSCYLSVPDFGRARKHLSEAETLAGGLGEAYNYLAALSRLYQAILECKEADEQEAGKSAESEKKELWKGKLAKAEKKLDEMFLLPAYDMNGRVESRGQMLRVEIGEKRQQLGLA